MKTKLHAILIALIPTLAFGQPDCELRESTSSVERCEATESIQSCTARINNLGVEQEVTADSVKEAVPNILDLVNTGDGSLSAFNDFLPLLRVLLNNGHLGDDQEELGFEASRAFGNESRKVQSKLFVLMKHPEVFTPIKEAMQAASLTDELTNLEDDISAQDDLSIGASFALASIRTGRDPRFHQKRLGEMVDAVDKGDPREINARKALRIFQFGNGIDPDIQDKPFCDLVPDVPGSTPDAARAIEAKRDEYIRLTSVWILAGREALRGFAARLRQSGFYDVLDLINNQPQLSATANYRSRTEAAGPNEFTFQLSWEGGFTDLNGLKDHEALDCGGVASDECLQSYLHPDGKETGKANPVRFKFDVNYTKIDRLNFVLPTPGFSYLTEATNRLAVSGIVGMDIGAALPGGKRTHFDGVLMYEDFSDDPLRQDRGVATVTVTYPLMQGFHLSLGATYATKAEFRGDVDKEIGARAGIIYKVAEDK